MPVHVVAQGECLSTIARRHGCAWQQIYDHPANSELKKKRPNPNVLAPGDEVVVPERGVTKWAHAKVESRNKFIVALPKVKLRVVLRSWKDEPYADKKFVVTVGERQHKGRTTGEGLVDVDLPATTREARLQVWFEEDPEDPDPNVDRLLAIGHLDPVETTAGLQARLHNLGFACAVTGELDEPTLAAARGFRAKAGLDEIALPEEPADSEADGEEGDDEDPSEEPAAEDEEPQESDEPEEDPREVYVKKLLDDGLLQKLRDAHDGVG